MEREIAIGLATIVTLGVGSQWLAARLKFPAIMLLLISGILAGPVFGLVLPDEHIGELLLPTVSLAVGLLLFEGGLELKLSELGTARGPILRLVTIGVLVTWIVGGIAAQLIFGFETKIAFLLSAILVVSGPTVVIPLVRRIRPQEPLATILRWEGIFIDPIGAILGAVFLTIVVAGDLNFGTLIIGIALRFIVGVIVGAIAGWVYVEVVYRYWVSDSLLKPVGLMLAVLAFTISGLILPESGLVATTVMGLLLANQKRAPIKQIAMFGENIGVLLIGALFIVLGARIELEAIAEVLLPALAFIAVLVLVARPLAAMASTIGSGLSWRQTALVGAMAPRGIVAAAIASLAALELEHAGIEVPELVPITFAVIIGTVTIYALGANPFAEWLGIKQAQPNGIALVGTQQWVFDLANELANNQVPVLVVATGLMDVPETVDGVTVFTDALETEAVVDIAMKVGVSEAIAVSPNREHNDFAIGCFVEGLGRANVYLLSGETASDNEHWGRDPFAKDINRQTLEAMIQSGGQFVTSDSHSDDIIPLFALQSNQHPVPVAAEGMRHVANHRLLGIRRE